MGCGASANASRRYAPNTSDGGQELYTDFSTPTAPHGAHIERVPTPTGSSCATGNPYEYKPGDDQIFKSAHEFDDDDAQEDDIGPTADRGTPKRQGPKSRLVAPASVRSQDGVLSARGAADGHDGVASGSLAGDRAALAALRANYGNPAQKPDGEAAALG